MFNSKVNRMTVIVKGVRDDDYEGHELMMEVIRRNCKMDSRLVKPDHATGGKKAARRDGFQCRNNALPEIGYYESGP